MPFLIAVAKGQKQQGINVKIPEIARHRAIYAIAHNRTNEVVGVLRELINDPNKSINRTARNAIEQVYKHHPVCPEKADEEYTAILIPIATDPNHPRNVFFIAEILRTRTEEGIEAIKKLAENPELDMPIAKTDSGVKAIRNLLRNSDEDIRNTTLNIIESVYSFYSGRPFKDEDFPDEFREDPEERKRRIIEMIQSWEN